MKLVHRNIENLSKLDAALTEIKVLVVEEKADTIYRECKVAVNLRNVEGVTGDECDYKPKLVKLERSNGEGYGFHLLYLDDRKGEYIEEVQPRGLASERTWSLRSGLAFVRFSPLPLLWCSPLWW